MTREEAISGLKSLVSVRKQYCWQTMKDEIKCIEMAIEALEHEPCEDCISRQAAIDALGEVHPLDYNAQAIKAKIEQLPSVQPIRAKEKWVFSNPAFSDYNVVCSCCQYDPCFDLMVNYFDSKNGLAMDYTYAPLFCPKCGAQMENGKMIKKIIMKGNEK